MLQTPAVPVEITDPLNAQILAVSEDRVAGFHADPFAEIARQAGVGEDVVLERLRAMLAAGTIRRIRQTMMATNLAPGALVAWQVPADRLDAAFDFMAARDPFSGHMVIRSTDAETPGSKYRLWSTLKVPQAFSMTKHCDFLAGETGALAYRLMPAKRLFALGVGHVRRKGMEPGSRSDEPGRCSTPPSWSSPTGSGRCSARSSASSGWRSSLPTPGPRGPRRPASRSTSSCVWRARSTSAAWSGASPPSSST
jgi:hypothetical protein